VLSLRQPAKFSAGRKAVHLRHDDVQQDPVRRTLPHHPHRLPAAGRFVDGVAALLQRFTQNGTHERFVIDDQRLRRLIAGSSLIHNSLCCS
jgi:hypothetical protein